MRRCCSTRARSASCDASCSAERRTAAARDACRVTRAGRRATLRSVQVPRCLVGLIFRQLRVDHLAFRRRVVGCAAIVAVFEWIAVVEDGDVADARVAQDEFRSADDVGVSSSAPSSGQTTPCTTASLPRWAKPIRYSSSCWSWKGPRPPAATRPGSRAWCREGYRGAHRVGAAVAVASRLAAK